MINSLTRRGFTEHEMLPEVNMTHMNGWVYEPTLRQFMSAAPNLQFAGFSQRYKSSVGSFCWIRCCVPGGKQVH